MARVSGKDDVFKESDGELSGEGAAGVERFERAKVGLPTGEPPVSRTDLIVLALCFGGRPFAYASTLREAMKAELRTPVDKDKDAALALYQQRLIGLMEAEAAAVVAFASEVDRLLMENLGNG